MRIHTNSLTERDLLMAAPDELYVDIDPHGSRSHARAYEVRLSFLGPKRRGDGRRFRNSGIYGAERILSATWDEHGQWFARLFDIDPDAVIGYYNGRTDFHSQTEYAYSTAVSA